MKAFVLEKPIPASEMKLSDIPTPMVKPGWVLVRIRAFGLNRSEIFTRQGDSPSVALPRVIGIECAGEIADPSNSTFLKGQRVISLMGGLGRQFDGSYAEYALIPASQVYPIDTSLDWVQLAALPETYFTAYGSLFDSLRVKSGDTLLIRGGTSSVGIAAIQLAKAVGVHVVATTRKQEKADLLLQYGADNVLIDDETIENCLHQKYPAGADHVLELVGTSTMGQSLRFLKKHGILCLTGILSGHWTADGFEPLDDISTATYLTTFHSNIVTGQDIAKMFCLEQLDK